MPTHPLIGLDVDGVIADLVQSLLDQIHEQTGQRFHPHQVRSFNLQDTLGDLWQVGQTILSEPGFASRIPPYPDALQGLDQLRKLGRVVFVTTPYEKNPTWSHDRTRWLERHTGAHPRDVVHLVDKTVFAGQLLIDDAPAQLEGWVASGRPAVRVVRPWNHGAPGHPASNWEEIVRVAHQLLQPQGPSLEA